MRRVHKALTLTSLVAILAGCVPASVDEPAEANPDGATAATDDAGGIESACGAYAYAYCGRLQACSPTALQLRYPTIASCEATFRAVCLNAATVPSTGSTPATVEACIAALPGWACSDFLYSQNTPPGCQEASGSRANGSPCAVRQQCQSGYCGFAPGAACGTCAAMPQAGDSCAATQCPPGLTCVQPSATCVAYAEVGAACGGAQPCNDGLTCVGATSTSTGMCQSGTQTLGGACAFGGAGCDVFAALSCNAMSGTCVTAPLGVAGAACGEVENQTAYCIAGTCPRGNCVASAAVGEACDLADGPPCLGTARCIVTGDSGTSGTCQINGSLACP
jgi:hypothetical protein